MNSGIIGFILKIVESAIITRSNRLVAEHILPSPTPCLPVLFVIFLSVINHRHEDKELSPAC